MPEGHTIHRIARDHGRLLAGRSAAAEALFVTGIHPLRPGTDCGRAELEALWSGMLRQGVKDNEIANRTCYFCPTHQPA